VDLYDRLPKVEIVESLCKKVSRTQASSWPFVETWT